MEANCYLFIEVYSWVSTQFGLVYMFRKCTIRPKYIYTLSQRTDKGKIFLCDTQQVFLSLHQPICLLVITCYYQLQGNFKLKIIYSNIRNLQKWALGEMNYILYKTKYILWTIYYLQVPYIINILIWYFKQKKDQSPF